MSLRANVHALVKEHLTTGPDGKPVSVPALLDELEAAFEPTSGGGASKLTAAKLPIDDRALSLWQDIDREVRDHQAELIGTDVGTLRGIIRSWAIESVLTPEWRDFLEHVSLDWIDRIEALLRPAKPFRPHRPCPACGQRFHGDERAPTLAVHWLDSDGEVMHPEQWSMACAACGAEWAGNTLGAIAWAMATDDAEVGS